MAKAIYLKVENELCFCQDRLEDGTEYEVHHMKPDEEYVKVNGHSRGKFGCVVYYKAKNFIMVMSEYEQIKHDKVEVKSHMADAIRYFLKEYL